MPIFVDCVQIVLFIKGLRQECDFSIQFSWNKLRVELLGPFFYTMATFSKCKWLFTCVLGQTGTITVTLCYSDTMLGADSTPIRGQGAGWCGCLALCQGPLAWVTIPCTVSWLNTLPRNWIWEKNENIWENMRKWNKARFK